MNFLRKNARYFFATNAFETFVVSCFVIHAVLAVFFYEVGILPGAVINIISCIFYAVCFCFKGEREQTGIFMFYIEIGLCSMLMVLLVSLKCGFFLYLLPLPFTSYLEVKDKRRRRGLFLAALIAMLLEIPVSLAGDVIFPEYRAIIEPYNYPLLMANFAVVILSNLYVISFMADKDKAISETQYKSEHDVLTGIYNRTFFTRYIKNLADEGPINGAIIMFDIDDFKKVNDQYGHDVGDLAIKMVTKVARSMVRSEDVVVRWGGEEFVIFINGMDLNKAQFKAEEIRSAIESTPYHEGKCLTVTIGVTEAHGNETFDTALKRADDNLYTGKTTGKNKVVAE